MNKAEHSLKKVDSRFLPFNKISQLRQQTRLNYQQVFEKQFLTELAKAIEIELKADKQSNPNKTYKNLKAYLMLGEPNHREMDYLSHWLTAFLQKNSDNHDSDFSKLVGRLRSDFEKPFATARLNLDAIEHARKQLKNLPKPMLAYLALKNTVPNRMAIDSPKELNIPTLYTAEGFKTIYRKLSKDICRNVLQGDWILGKNPEADDSIYTVNFLEHQVRTLYLADYVNWWNLFISDNHPKMANSLDQINSTLTLLKNSDTAWNQLLGTVIQNTAPLPSDGSAENQSFNQQVSSQFKHLLNLSPDQLSESQDALNALQIYLQTILHANDRNKASFSMAKLRFLNPNAPDPIAVVLQEAKRSPQPIRDWLSTLALNSWYLILQNTQTYLSDQWHHTIYNEFKSTIAHRFPVDTQSKNEISLGNFIQFFGEKGSLKQYFELYLKPFINAENTQWEMKKRDGLGLTVSENTLNQFIRGNIIRKMFFTGKDHQLAVDFSLKPLHRAASLKTITLQVNDQKLFDYQGSYKTSPFSWPAKDHEGMAQLIFNTQDDKTQQLNESGPWAWFKLLNKATLAKTTDTQHYSILFKLNGLTSKYELIAKTVINPFIPGVIDKFDLPKDIITQHQHS